jgi:protease-4
MRTRAHRFGAFGCAAVLGAALLAELDAPAHAQTPVPRPSRIEPPARTLAGTDDADALALAPSQLAFAPGWELRYTHVQLPDSTTRLVPGAGDSLGFALPLLLGFATGVRFEDVRPPASTGVGHAAGLTLALAWKYSEQLSFGLDLRRWWSSEPALDGVTSFDASASYRPWNWLGFALAWRDFNAPAAQGPGLVVPSLDAGLVIRPLGTRAIELGLESTFWKQGPPRTGWSPRAELGVEIPYVGRAVAGLRIDDPASTQYAVNYGNSWTVTAGLELGLSRELTVAPARWYERVGGGVIAGPGLRPAASGDGGVGWYASASIAGFRQPGLPDLAGRAVKIRVEETPGARGHVRLLRRLARLARDRSVKAVALVLKAEPAGSLAHAEELARAIDQLHAAGIKVLCHLEDGGGRSLYTCAGADKIYIQPAGGVRFAGLRTQGMYFGEALSKLGIEPDFVRIKEHKSAAEAFVRKGPTEIAAADHREYLEIVEREMMTHIAKGRAMPIDRLRATIAKGPFVADEAVAAGLIDGKAFDDEVRAKVSEMVGRSINLEDDEADKLAPRAFGSAPRLAVIYLDGDIVDGRSQTIPLLGEKTAGSYTVSEAIDAARRDPSIKGVMLRIESPGGSSLASDVMWRSLELLAHQKPVVVSMGSIAASGGYYAASFGAPIWANAFTLTGSIGIFYGKADVSGLLGKLGIHVVTDKTAPKADAESLYRPFTDEERAELLTKVEQFYAVFLDRVSRGRHLSVEAVDAVGHGKVWLGVQALDKKLVDHVGGFDEALAELRQQALVDDDTPLVELPKESGGLIDFVLDAVGASAPVPSALALPKQIAPYAQALVPFVTYAADTPLALYEAIGVP